jgi:broad specificity phosphatase PhoE
VTTFLLVRHGQTDWNMEGRYTGQSDIPLNDTGRRQAREVARRMAADTPPEAVYSSDLVRARETAEIIAGAIQIELRTDPRLREIDQGEWEGMLFADIKGRYEAEFGRMRQDPANVGPPGGETVGQVWDRVLAAAGEIAKAHPHSRVALVSHGLALAVIKARSAGLPVEKIWDIIPPNAEIEKVEW